MNTHLHHQVIQSEDHLEWVVFVHGAGGNISTWKKQVNALSPFYNLLLIDLRDHGQSKNIQPSYESYNFKIASSDLKLVLDSCKIRQAHFITLSFGSVLIQDFSRRYPSLVDKMIIAGGIFNANLWIKLFVHSARLLNVFLPYRTMYFIFSYLLMPRKSSQAARKVYQLQAYKLTSREYVKWLGLYSEFFKLLDQFHQQPVDKEMHVIMGANDYMFLPSARHFTARHANATLHVLPKSGHICNIETPALFNALALTCLAKKTQKKDDRPKYRAIPVDRH